LELSDLKGRYSGRLWCVGNGPSLNLLTPEQKKGITQDATFAGSRYFLWAGWTPTFYVLTERKQNQEWLDQALHGKARASGSRFWVDWQPPPQGWIAVPHPPNGEAHDVLNYGVSKCLWGKCGEFDGRQHIAHGKVTPLAMVQLGLWMGFSEFYLIGCEATNVGEAYDAEKTRNFHAPGIERQYFARAAGDAKIIDCTPGGTLAKERGGPLQYRDLDEVLDEVRS
tara:strand:- start:9326 stop:10000 length:675 start_codon:yes stop_codon:yes gene_type:complete